MTAPDEHRPPAAQHAGEVPSSPPAPASPAPTGSTPASPAGAARPAVSHPAAPTPPRSRMGAHVLSLFAALVLTPIALASLGGGAHAIEAAVAADSEPSAAAIVAVIAAAVLFGIVAAASAGSAAGPLVGGMVYGVAPGVGFLLAPDTLESATAAAFEPVALISGDDILPGLLMLGRTAGLLVLGLTVFLVGLAAAIARRRGKRVERAEAFAVAAQRTYPGSAPSVPVAPRARRLEHLGSLAVGVLVTPVALVLVAAGTADLAEASQQGDPVTAGLLLGAGALGTGLLVIVVLAAGWSSFGLLVAGLVYGVAPGVMGLVFPQWRGRAVGGFLEEVGAALEPAAVEGLALLTTLGVLLAWGSVAALGSLGVHAARKEGQRRERAELLVERLAARGTPRPAA